MCKKRIGLKNVVVVGDDSLRMIWVEKDGRVRCW